jgi:hypothetical protein
MSIEIVSFFMIAAALVLVGFASGPVVARKFGSAAGTIRYSRAALHR